MERRQRITDHGLALEGRAVVAATDSTISLPLGPTASATPLLACLPIVAMVIAA